MRTLLKVKQQKTSMNLSKSRNGTSVFTKFLYVNPLYMLVVFNVDLWVQSFKIQRSSLVIVAQNIGFS